MQEGPIAGWKQCPGGKRKTYLEGFKNPKHRPVMRPLPAGAATTDDIHPGSSAEGFGAPAPLPRVNVAKSSAAAGRPGP